MDHKMRTLIFFTTFARKISHSKKSWATYDQNCILTFMYSDRYFCHLKGKTLEFSQQILEKYSNTKFDGNPSSGTRVVPCRRTERQADRHDESNKRFS